MQVKKQQLEPGMNQQTGSKLGKEYVKAVYCHPASYMQSTSCEMLGWRKHKLESRLPGEISITWDRQMIPLYGRKRRQTREPLDKAERGEWKTWLKSQHYSDEDHGIQTHHSWQVDRETVETVRHYFLGLQIFVGGDCSHEIKRHLLLGRKAMTNLDSILKTEYFANKCPSSQSDDFSSSHVWMWELDHNEN